MKIRNYIFLFLLLYGCSKTELVVTGPAETVPVGTTFSVDVSIYKIVYSYKIPDEPWYWVLSPYDLSANVENLYGIAFDLWYDPAVISLQSIDKSTGLLNSGELQYSFRNSTAGKLVIGLSLVGSVSGINGKGNILRITFSGISPGTTNLILHDIHIYDSSGNKLDAGVIINNGTVVVQ